MKHELIEMRALRMAPPTPNPAPKERSRAFALFTWKALGQLLLSVVSTLIASALITQWSAGPAKAPVAKTETRVVAPLAPPLDDARAAELQEQFALAHLGAPSTAIVEAPPPRASVFEAARPEAQRKAAAKKTLEGIPLPRPRPKQDVAEAPPAPEPAAPVISAPETPSLGERLAKAPLALWTQARDLPKKVAEAAERAPLVGKVFAPTSSAD